MERQIDSEGTTVADAILDVLDRIADSLEKIIEYTEEAKKVNVEIVGEDD